jgi:hypothetical protein
MEQADSLLGLMESAVGLAGFTAVVLVLRPQQSKIGLRTIFAVRTALANSIAAVFACLIALGVSAAGVDGSTRWRASSAIYLVLILYFLVVFFRDTIRARPLWHPLLAGRRCLARERNPPSAPHVERCRISYQSFVRLLLSRLHRDPLPRRTSVLHGRPWASEARRPTSRCSWPP